eukprot:Seg1311.4 transcript_id=Seg1311.4/GoldUCD/mRNA.D3Y31 product="Bcl-2-related ovarian killer protein" protein_id=Seg1311.4/GoldUCD/D3Y31
MTLRALSTKGELIVEALIWRLKMAVVSSDCKSSSREDIVKIAKQLCDDYVEDRLIRSGLQLKERKLGNILSEILEEDDEERPARPNRVSVTSWSRSRSFSNAATGNLGMPEARKLSRTSSNPAKPGLFASSDDKERRAGRRFLPIDKKNPADISRVLVSVGEILETRHAGVYIDVLSQLNINLVTELTLKRAFNGVAKHIFADGISWAKIVSFFAFTGALAVDCVINGANVYVGKLKSWTVKFIRENLCDWIMLQDGWVMIEN